MLLSEGQVAFQINSNEQSPQHSQLAALSLSAASRSLCSYPAGCTVDHSCMRPSPTGFPVNCCGDTKLESLAEVTTGGSPQSLLSSLCRTAPCCSQGESLCQEGVIFFALDRGWSGNAQGELVFPRKNSSTCMTRIYACSSNNFAFLNSTLIVVCLADDLEHLIYWSYFTLPAIWSDLASRFSLPNRGVFK